MRTAGTPIVSCFGGWFLLVLLVASCCNHDSTVSAAYQICPGTGLYSLKTNTRVVIFEHTIHGTGGLVLNCPTPLCIGQLPSSRFRPFKELPLMLGSGLEEERKEDDDDDDDNDDEDHDANDENDDGMSNKKKNNDSIALGEVSPWFWLHDLDDIPGSSALPGAAGTLYMGGDLEEAIKRLEERGINPLGHFKFFRKYKTWQVGELEDELQRGIWVAMEQDPKQALEPVSLGLKLL